MIDEILYFCGISAIEDGPEFLHFDEAGVVLVEVLEGFAEGLPYVQFILVVHRNDKFVKIDLARTVLVNRLYQTVDLLLFQRLEVVLQDLDEF